MSVSTPTTGIWAAYRVLVSVFVLIAACAWYAAAGLRGTDQYWYVSAVTAHCSGTGYSNQIWPIFLANQPGYVDAPQFLHATSLTKVLGVMGCWTSAYSAWFWANLLAVAVTSFLTFHCVRSLTGRTVTAQLAFLACLANPASLWLMSQPLLETALSSLLACAVAALVFLRRLDVAVLLCGVMLMAAETVRSSYQFAFFGLALAAVVYLCVWRRNLRQAAIVIVGAIVVAALGWSVAGNTLQMPLTAIAMNGTSGQSNMALWLGPSLPEFNTELYLEKVAEQFKRFASPATLPFFLPYLALTSGALILIAFNAGRFLRGKAGRTARVAVLFVLLTGLYLVTVTVHQNQFRYTVPLMPVGIILFFTLVPNRIWSLRGAGWAPVMLAPVAVAVAGALALYLHKGSVQETADRASFRANVLSEPAIRDATELLYCYDGASLRNAFVLEPRRIFYVPNNGDLNLLQYVHGKTATDVLLCAEGATAGALIDAGANGTLVSVGRSAYWVFEL